MSIINKEAECDNCEDDHGGHKHSSSKLIFKVEKSMIKTAFYNLIFLILIEIIAYFGFFKNIPNLICLLHITSGFGVRPAIYSEII